MLFDINTSVGHWPFRSVPHQTPSALKEHLLGKGITGAAVANTNGLFYKNCHDANLELAEWLSDHRDFFTGVATLNPLYPAWERDLRTCVETFGFRALRLAPRYHNYRLDVSPARAMVSAAGNLGVPVIIPATIIDLRQRQWMDVSKAVESDEVSELCLAEPETAIIYTHVGIRAEALLDGDGKLRYPNLYLDTSRLLSSYGREAVASLAHSIGNSHVLFGTGAPFKEVTPALLKLQHPDLTAEDRDKISSKNACKLLGI